MEDILSSQPPVYERRIQMVAPVCPQRVAAIAAALEAVVPEGQADPDGRIAYRAAIPLIVHKVLLRATGDKSRPAVASAQKKMERLRGQFARLASELRPLLADPPDAEAIALMSMLPRPARLAAVRMAADMSMLVAACDGAAQANGTLGRPPQSGAYAVAELLYREFIRLTGNVPVRVVRNGKEVGAYAKLVEATYTALGFPKQSGAYVARRVVELAPARVILLKLLALRRAALQNVMERSQQR
jgi:hypothetical protein